ncbi:MAG: CDP-archaeol synthase [Lachnospiraceae bacterium]|nr:CDP-archaeol synthase [Lachnospiraceae bacterium]
MIIFKILANMYITLLGPVIAGIVNSLWCKCGALRRLQVPMDGGKHFIDGKRILGDNKTWKGFLGYIILNIICMVTWGFICDRTGLENYNMFYQNVSNSLINNLVIGSLLGLAYGIFELPNSFLKRRLGITPGKSVSGFTKLFFVFFDQADSVFGCVLVVCLFAPMSVGFYMLYVVVGSITHIIINMLLYVLKLRKNMF